VTGFLSRVSRYARPSLVEQRENRLTEVFAAVLERTDGLALQLAKSWLSPDAGEGANAQPALWSAARAALDEDDLTLRLPVRTERPTHSGRVDLELRFRRRSGSSADDVVIWVEVKHGTGPHEHQLSNYSGDLARLNVRAGAVVLLAPRWSYPFASIELAPSGVPQRTWQQTAALCARWRSADAVQRFLVKEFLKYLQEESLMDPDVITPLHLVALAEHRRALEGVVLALEVASGYIEREWNDCAGREDGARTALRYSETHPKGRRGQPPEDWGPRCFWDWNLRGNDSVLEDSRGGVPFFIAGAGVNKRQVLVTAEAAGWAAKLHESDGFVELNAKYNRFVRVAYPEEVLVGRTLQQQGESLGRWVVDTYDALYAAGSPPGRPTTVPTS
jgi:hypothetical protein